MKKILCLMLFLGACNGTFSEGTDMVSEGPDMLEVGNMVPYEPDTSVATGGVPLGFYERGCQWDNPACGPTPGGRPVGKLQPDDR